MKKLSLLIILIAFAACNSTKVNGEKYKTSLSTTELATIGISNTKINTDNEFFTKAIPVLENKIRLDIKILPFDQKINAIYISKAKSNQSLKTINYIDSLPKKPEYASISLFDINGYTNELNSIVNKEVFNLIKDTKEIETVSAIAIVLTEEALEKIRQADTYYLVNNKTKKYTLSLYKQGKQLDVIDLNEGVTIGYSLSKFCWTQNERQHWYIADLVSDNKNCMGNTHERVKDKEEINLFKM